MLDDTLATVTSRRSGDGVRRRVVGLATTIVWAACSLLPLGATAQEPEPPAGQPSPEAAGRPADAPEALRPPRRRVRLDRRPWFEIPEIASKAKIGEEQLEQIRALVDVHTERQRAILEEQRGDSTSSLRARLYAALAQPELDEPAARELVTQIEKGASALASNRYGLRIAVRRLLGAEQVASLQELQPNWLAQPWIKPPERPRRPRGRRRGAPAP